MNGIDSGPGINRWRFISSRFLKKVRYYSREIKVQDKKGHDDAKDKMK
jgi:hypothetical protein